MIVDKTKLVFGEVELKLFAEVFGILRIYFGFIHLIAFESILFTSVIITKLSEDQHRVLEKIVPEHVTEQLDGVLQMLTTTRLLRVQDDQKSVHEAQLFETPYHFFDVLSVSTPGVADAWSVQNDVRVLVALISISRHNT